MAGRDVNININGKDNFSPAANSAGRSAVSLKGALGGLNAVNIGGAGLGTLFSVAGITAITGASIKLAAGYEQTNVAFKTMLKSGGAATDLLGKLSKFAQETPFQFTELTDASKKLLAFGVSANDIVPTLQRIGDISAAIGAPVGEIAELYGKAKVQGRLFAEDINQLTGRGIPIIQQLTKQFGVQESEIRKLVETGQVGFKNLEQAFIDMTGKGGQFQGMMVEQSKTLLGQWSNLKDLMEQVGRTLGGKVVPLLKDAAGAANWWMGNGMTGVPKPVGKEGGLAGAGLGGDMAGNGRDIINMRDAIATGKRQLMMNIRDPEQRRKVEQQIAVMEGRLADAKGQFGIGMDKSNAFRARIGSGLSGFLGGASSGVSGLLGGAFESVKQGTEFGVGKIGNAATIAKLFNETRTPQEKFDAAMAKLRSQRGDIGDDLFNRKRRMLEDDLAATFEKNKPHEKFKERDNARLIESRFMTSAPGYSADPGTKAAQETANTSKEQLVVLRAMERKLARQTRLGVL